MPIPTSEKIAAEIANLSALSDAELRLEWDRTFGTEPPKSARREYLLRALVHELQTNIYGSLSPALLRQLLKYAESRKSPENLPVKTRTLKIGTKILREWKGAVHEVEVIDDGYRYQDQIYKSLSIIAREITGTRWSGPLFFGLKCNNLETLNGV